MRNALDRATSTLAQERVEEIEAMLARARGRMALGESMPDDVRAEFAALEAAVAKWREANPYRA